MRKNSPRWRNWLRIFPHLEILEERTPVSETLGTAVSWSALGAMSRLPGTAQAPPPPPYSAQIPKWSFGSTSADTKATFPWNPSVHPEAERAVNPESRFANSLRPDLPTSLTTLALGGDPFAGTEQVSLELLGSFPQADRQPPHLPVAENAPLTNPPVGAEAEPVPPPDAARAPISASAEPLFLMPHSAFLDEATLAAVAHFGAAGPGSVNPVDLSGGPTIQDSGDGGDHHHHKPGDPLTVLDANNTLVLGDGGTIHDFSGWNVDLYAQVSGATVAANGYNWTFNATIAPDVNQGTVTGQGTYHLHFQWNSFSDSKNPVHSDKIGIETTNTNGTHQFQNFFFAVYATDSPQCNFTCTQVNSAPTFPLRVPPDAVKPDQETVNAPYYSLGEETGEVMTHHTLPAYHPAVAPLQLDYSSLAANAKPIFREFYQLGQSPQTTVTASLKLNGVVQGTPTVYDTSQLNPGDILDIALQGDATGLGLTQVRYPYEIDVTEGSFVNPPVTGNVSIINSAASPFGAGWSLDNLEHVWPASDGTGATLELPGGKSLWFALVGGTYRQPPGDFSTFQQIGSNYRRTLKDGTQINFNSSGYQTSIFEPIPYFTTTFGYNTQNPPQLISITDFQGGVVTLAYNAGKVSSIQDPSLLQDQMTHRTTQLGYDGANTQLTSITDPDPGFGETAPVHTFGYAANQMTTLRDPRGNLFTFAYNSAGRIGTVSRPDNTTETVAAQQLNGLSAAALVVEVGANYTDPRGKGWFEYPDWSGFGHGLEHFDPLNDETIIHRDNYGLPWMTEDPLDRATRTFFDQGGSLVQGNPTKMVLPDGAFQQYSYNDKSQVVSATDPNGNATNYGYTGTTCQCVKVVGLPAVAVPIGPLVSPQYTFAYNLANGFGFLTSVTDPNMNSVTHGYDTQNRKNSTNTLSDSGQNVYVTLGYNTASDVTSITDELNHVTTFTVDNLGRTLVTTLPVDIGVTGRVITAAFDTAGNRISITDPLPLPNPQTDKTLFHFDSMNRVDQVTDPYNLVTTTVYDEAGNVKDIFDRDILPSLNHRNRHFIYDDAGRLITEQWRDGSTVNYTANYSYDEASELTSASDNNSSYSFAYDSRGREVSVDNANTLNIPHVVLTSQYDANSNRTQVTDNWNGAISYGYDADDRLTQISMNVTGAMEHPVIALAYDLGARLTNIKRSTSTGGNQVNTALGYTTRDQVKTINHSSSNGRFMPVAYSYGYDPARRLQNYSSSDGGILNYALTYSYDSINQLTGVTATNSTYNENYSYTDPIQGKDLNGNRSSANGQNYGAPAAANRLTSDGQYTYAYDKEGNLISKSGMESGFLATYSFTWDFRNRLIEAKKTWNTQVADDHFTYDVFNRRIGKQIGSSQIVWTAYDGLNPYVDFVGSVPNTTLANRYVYGNQVDELYARTDGNGNTTAWYLTDNLGSVRQIVDANGNTLYKANYFSFGGIVPGSESGSGGDRFKFAGREWDGEVGLYYNRARYYDPNTGRFISEDPLQFWAGDPNLYRYVFNVPTVLADPTGLNTVVMGLVATPGLASVLIETGVLAGKAATITVAAVLVYEVCTNVSQARKSDEDEADLARNQERESRRQNQARKAGNKAVKKIAEKLRMTNEEADTLHDIISRRGYSISEIEQIAREIKGL